MNNVEQTDALSRGLFFFPLFLFTFGFFSLSIIVIFYSLYIKCVYFGV